MAGLLRLLRAKYNPPADPTGVSFAGKIVVLTGATSGLGFEAAAKITHLGADLLIIGARNAKRAEQTKRELERRTNRIGAVQTWELDLDSFESVTQFARRVDRQVERVDVLLLNAGVWNGEYVVTTDGWEETLQVNTLSTSLLALLLLPKLRRSASISGPAHLTVVSSQLFTSVKAESLRDIPLLLERLNTPPVSRKQYAISKLLLEYVVKKIARLTRNEDGTIQVVVNSVCPGMCASSLARNLITRSYQRWLVWIFYKLFARTAEQGSRSLVSATVQGVESQGKTWKDDSYLE